MRISRVCALAVAAALALAPAANASFQNLRSPTARDVAAATNPRPIHRPVHEAGAPRVSPQAAYYASYGKPTPTPDTRPADRSSSPWVALGAGLALTFVAAGAVAFAVRSRRRVARLRMS
jgi:hypothetical protein